MNQPLISVIIPAHNSQETIAAAINSILNQTYPNSEIIVINDNSTDDTMAVVRAIEERDPRVRCFSLPFDDPHRYNKRGRNVNAGYSARNYGFEKVNGEWITFQDADDMSLRNRIEAEYILAERYQSNHICVQWCQLTDTRLDASFDFEKALTENPNIITSSEDITELARKTRGFAMQLLGKKRGLIPFEIKTMRVINKLFFASLESYPGSGNSPLFKKEVINKVKFREMNDRVWPSFTGRGADRDFNFQVAETFGKSITIELPLYLWRVNRENNISYDFEKYLIR
jgi:glycosyltransferase involved in cell wall biosynthesis